MKTSLKKYLAVVTRGDYKVPSRVYAVKASSAAVAVKRALLKAQADYPCYKNFDITVDTITSCKVKRFNREVKTIRNELGEAYREVKSWQRSTWSFIDRLITRRERAEWYNAVERALLKRKHMHCQQAKSRAEALELAWLQMIELHDAVNAE